MGYIKLFEEFDRDDINNLGNKVIDLPHNLLDTIIGDDDKNYSSGWSDNDLSESFTVDETRILEENGFIIYKDNLAIIQVDKNYAKIKKEVIINQEFSGDGGQEYLSDIFTYTIRNGKFGKLSHSSPSFSDIGSVIDDCLSNL